METTQEGLLIQKGAALIVPYGHITALSLTPPRLLTSGYLEVKCEENRFTSPADPRNPFSISVLDPQAQEEAALFCRDVEELRRKAP